MCLALLQPPRFSLCVCSPSSLSRARSPSLFLSSLPPFRSPSLFFSPLHPSLLSGESGAYGALGEEDGDGDEGGEDDNEMDEERAGMEED